MIEEYEEGHILKGPHRNLGAGDHVLQGVFMPLHLELQSPEPASRRLALKVTQPTVLVGRHTCADVRLAYPEVSRRHCRLAFRESYWHIIDLNSLNGLFVNGERVQEAVLQEGDTIRLGSVTMSVLSPADEETYQDEGLLGNIADNFRQPPNWPPLAA